MADDTAFDKYFIFRSADAVGKGPFSTEEILDAHRRGLLDDRTVIHHRYASRRQGFTVKELVERTRGTK